ncbi:hypothetical protein BKA93DRAFT_830137 [Sparassis latifolia]|uniref:Uncharacterized protein n=1 Tax=Sparassis crispa TaxID=139825 RepID=A0A401GAZ2_9APHY|nr:predicted protein [Sparassis crispa]GBE79338.1 predicted protein [Sparassis crispa]
MSVLHLIRIDDLSDSGVFVSSDTFGGNDGNNDGGDSGGLGGQLSSLFSPFFPPNSQSSQSSILTLSASSTPSLTSSPSPSDAPQPQPTSSENVSSAASNASSSSFAAASDTASASDTVSASPSATASGSPFPAPSGPSDSASSTVSSTASASHTGSASSFAAAAATSAPPKSFLQNKALSVGVITAASLIGLVLLIVIATFAIRRRRRDKLQPDAVDFDPDASSDQLVGGGGDVEHGNRPRISRERRASKGTGSNESSQAESSPAGPSYGQTVVNQNSEMFERTGYPALPVFVPAATADGERYPTMGYSSQSAYPAYNTNTYEHGYPYNALLPTTVGPPRGQGPSNLPYDTTYPRTLHPPQRKQVPALIPLDIGATTAPQAHSNSGPPSALSIISLSASPLRAAAMENSANPPAYSSVALPPPKRSSQLRRVSASPMESSLTSGTIGDGQGMVRMDPTLPQIPVFALLPDEFGGTLMQEIQSDEKRARRFTVRNE